MAGSPAATQEIDCAQAPVDLVAEPALREPGVLALAAQNGPEFFRCAIWSHMRVCTTRSRMMPTRLGRRLASLAFGRR